MWVSYCPIRKGKNCHTEDLTSLSSNGGESENHCVLHNHEWTKDTDLTLILRDISCDHWVPCLLKSSTWGWWTYWLLIPKQGVVSTAYHYELSVIKVVFWRIKLLEFLTIFPFSENFIGAYDVFWAYQPPVFIWFLPDSLASCHVLFTAHWPQSMPFVCARMWDNPPGKRYLTGDTSLKKLTLSIPAAFNCQSSSARGGGFMSLSPPKLNFWLPWSCVEFWYLIK